jgi:hypothetical protein
MVCVRKLSSGLLFGGCIAIIATAVVATAGQDPRARAEVRVGVAPTPFSGSDDQTHLAYELTMTGVVGTKGARLERVEVFGELDGKPLLRYAIADLDDRVSGQRPILRFDMGDLFPTAPRPSSTSGSRLRKIKPDHARSGIRSPFQPKTVPR